MHLNGYVKTAETLVKLGRQMSHDFGDCNYRTKKELLDLAATNQRFLFDDDHVRGCPSCCWWLELFRSAAAIEKIGKPFSVVLSDLPAESGLFASQTLGLIDLTSQDYEHVEDEVHWRASPTQMRSNFVMDTRLGIASLTLLEVPSAINSVQLEALES